jgi:hypothetical protein
MDVYHATSQSLKEGMVGDVDRSVGWMWVTRVVVRNHFIASPSLVSVIVAVAA